MVKAQPRTPSRSGSCFFARPLRFGAPATPAATPWSREGFVSRLNPADFDSAAAAVTRLVRADF
jgi:hypothetical protein